MKSILGLLTKKQKIMRDQIFKNNPVDRSHKNRYYRDFLERTQHTAKVVASTSGNIMQ